MIKSALKKLLHTTGYNIVRYPPKKKKSLPLHNIHTMEAGLLRAKNRNSQFSTVIDVGAAAGTWTEKAISLWPDANYALFEPLQEREGDLKKICEKYNQSNIQVVPAVLGEKNGTVAFTVSDDLDGSGVYEDISDDAVRKVKMVSLDSTLKDLKLSGPYLIKLDTHGFEVPILEGAKETLERTNLLIIEVYGFHISKTSLLFYELCTYLDKLGFRPLDIVDTMRRPADYAFWQCDIFFVPKTHHTFEKNSYQ